MASGPHNGTGAAAGAAEHTRVVVLVGFEGIQILDVTGPLEVFSRASRLLLAEGGATIEPYRVMFVARERGPVNSSSGLQLVATSAWRDLPTPDTLLVSGGIGTHAALKDHEFIDWLRRQAPLARRYGAVCTGAMLLARAGLLDQRRVTTHWAFTQLLAEMAPTARVENDPIFVRDGSLWTSAGVTAGMDMALAMVEQDWGRKLAIDVAHQLVMPLKRHAGASQVSSSLAAQAKALEGRFRQLSAWIMENLATELTIPMLAQQAGISPRHFARCFQDEIGVTPAKFVESARFEAARQLLAEEELTLEKVAARCGFGSAETLRRVFIRRVGMSPAAYRLRLHQQAVGVSSGPGEPGL